VTHSIVRAQVNIARMLAPLDDPVLAGFVANLEGINALADSSPGFVWRLKTEAGDATSLRPYDETTIESYSTCRYGRHPRTSENSFIEARTLTLCAGGDRGLSASTECTMPALNRTSRMRGFAGRSGPPVSLIR
jgi:Domain of unknown function (DUF3291)